MPLKTPTKRERNKPMATFSETAPRISRVKTETDIEADYVTAKATPAPVTEPELTNEKISQAYELLKDVEAANGYLTIARTVGISQSQVKSLHQEIKKAVSFVRAEKVEPVEEPVKDPIIRS